MTPKIEILSYHSEDHQEIRRIFSEGQLENVKYGIILGLQNPRIKAFLGIATIIGFSFFNSWFHTLFCPILAWLIQIFSVWHCYYFYVKNVLKTDLKDKELKFWTSIPNAFVVAKLNGKVVGCGSYKKVNEETVEMHRVAVDYRFRGMKIGKALVSTLMNKAKNEGFKIMYLETSQAQIVAQKMYEKMGFQFLRRLNIGEGYLAFLHNHFSGLYELAYIKKL